MIKDEIKIGDKLRVSKERWETELRKSLPPYARIGIVYAITCEYVHIHHEGRSFTISWYPRDLEPHDHREPCACFECVL